MAKVSKDAPTEAREELEDMIEGQDLPVPAEGGTTLVVGSVDLDDDDLSDIKIPRLQVTHNSGKARDAGWELGDLVLDLQHRVAGTGDPVRFFTLSLDKYWKEDIPYDPGVIPKEYRKTKKEMVDMGFQMEYRDDPDNKGRRLNPDYKPAAKSLVLIEKPEGCSCPLFTLTMESMPDSLFTPAIWYTDKTGYNASFKNVVSALKVQLAGAGDDRLLAGLWETQTATKTWNTTTYSVPNVRLESLNSPEVIQELRDRFQGFSV